eukprot:jgi/Mesvir1/21419/Mv20890-RA.1
MFALSTARPWQMSYNRKAAAAMRWKPFANEYFVTSPCPRDVLNSMFKNVGEGAADQPQGGCRDKFEQSAMKVKRVVTGFNETGELLREAHTQVSIPRAVDAGVAPTVLAVLPSNTPEKPHIGYFYDEEGFKATGAANEAELRA